MFMHLFQSEDAVNPDRLYDLVAVVVHCGSGPNRGHYISIVKSHGFWLLFDDDMVDVSFSFITFCKTEIWLGMLRFMSYCNKCTCQVFF